MFDMGVTLVIKWNDGVLLSLPTGRNRLTNQLCHVDCNTNNNEVEGQVQ